MLLLGITLFAAFCAIAAAVTKGFWAAVAALFGGWLGGLVLVLLFLVAVTLVVDRETEPERDSKFYRTIARLYIELGVTLGRVKIQSQGLEKVPGQGRFMLVCNHLNELDPVVIMHCLPQSQLAFISKKENKNFPIVAPVMHKLMCPLIDRENDRQALKVILRCIDMIRKDLVSVGVFPEGYVSLDGRLKHFRGGVFKIAQKTGVPIVVCTIKNTKKAMHNLLRLRGSWVRFHVVDVIDAETVKQTPTLDMAEKVYEIMISDLGEAYRTDEKATHPKDQLCIDPIE